MNLKPPRKLKQPSNSKNQSNHNQQHTHDDKAKSLLKDEKFKIQNKLDALRAEIAERKNNKNKDIQSKNPKIDKVDFKKTGTGSRWRTDKEIDNTHLNKFLATTQQKTSSKVNIETEKLLKMLEDLRMQKFFNNITQEKHIEGFSHFLELSENDIDEWKDIPVGFRIKLKKIIGEHSKVKQQQSFSDKQKKESLNIEDIISKRKQNRIFQPIHKQIDSLHFENAISEPGSIDENTHKLDEDEDALMNSLNMVFLGRKSMMRKSSFGSDQDNSEKKGVKWDQNVQNFRSEEKNKKKIIENSKYPCKDLIRSFEEEQKLIEVDGSEDKPLRQKKQIFYCWNCLKRIDKITNASEGKNFCKQECFNEYKAATSLHQIQEQVKECELKIKQIQLEEKELENEEIHEIDLDLD